jgi:hypothetical protein
MTVVAAISARARTRKQVLRIKIVSAVTRGFCSEPHNKTTRRAHQLHGKRREPRFALVTLVPGAGRTAARLHVGPSTSCAVGAFGA